MYFKKRGNQWENKDHKGDNVGRRINWKSRIWRRRRWGNVAIIK